MEKQVFAIVHNVRSLHNVGSIFRTADGAGITKLYLTGYTPAPLDEMGRPEREIHKTALGAEQVVLWEKRQDPRPVIRELKKTGTEVLALENTRIAKNIFSHEPSFPVAFLVGNEVRGISQALLDACDGIFQIPMQGKKESLNVSVAFGIAAFYLTR